MEMRCTGHCCKRFILPVSPDNLQFALKLQKEDRNDIWYDDNNRCHRRIQDIEILCDMLIHLGAFRYNANDFTPTMGIYHHYTCKYFDEKSGNCLIYEKRPAMCRNYPDEGFCRYIGCTSDKALKFLPEGRGNG